MDVKAYNKPTKDRVIPKDVQPMVSESALVKIIKSRLAAVQSKREEEE